MGATIQNIQNEHQFDVCIVTLDMPMQARLLKMFEGRPFKYIGVMPLESNPFILPTAMMLMQMDKVFCISQFGTDEINKLNVGAEHLVIGMDTEAWKLRTQDEYETFRERLGFAKEDYVILSVADNQERKNISASMEIVAGLKKRGLQVKFVLITRPNLQVGWNLQAYATELGIQNEYVEVQRGISFKDLWVYYATADVFLSCAKAEGLSMPVLESMSVGVPVVAGSHTALNEHLSDGKGFPVDTEYIHRDPFLNGYRYWINKAQAEQILWDMWDNPTDEPVRKARAYVESKNWSDTLQQMEKALDETCNDSES